MRKQRRIRPVVLSSRSLRSGVADLWAGCLKRRREEHVMRMFVVLLAAALVLGIGSYSAQARHHGMNGGQCDPPASQPAKVFDGFDAALKTVPPGVLPAKADGWT